MADIAVFFTPGDPFPDLTVQKGDTVWWINKNNSAIPVEIQTKDEANTGTDGEFDDASQLYVVQKQFKGDSPHNQPGTYKQRFQGGSPAPTVIVVGPQ